MIYLWKREGTVAVSSLLAYASLIQFSTSQSGQMMSTFPPSSRTHMLPNEILLSLKRYREHTPGLIIGLQSLTFSRMDSQKQKKGCGGLKADLVFSSYK